MNDIRDNGIVGVVQVGDDDKDYIHFSEWWNGEGLDISFNTDLNKYTKLSLHIDELHALAVTMVISKYINIEDVEEDVKRIEGYTRKAQVDVGEPKICKGIVSEEQLAAEIDRLNRELEEASTIANNNYEVILKCNRQINDLKRELAR